MRYLVVAGTGTVGSQVARNLADMGLNVRVMSRTEERIKLLPSEIEGMVGDLASPETLAPVFEGIDAMFFTIAFGLNETELGLNAIQTAKDAGIKKVVYMSVALPPGAEVVPHFASKIPIEKALMESGIDYTILRPVDFYQNDLWVKEIVENYGIYPFPIGQKGIGRVDVRDIADAAVTALTEEGHAGKIYDIYGPKVWTGPSIAEVYSRQLSRDVNYIGDDLGSWAAQASQNMPQWMVDEFVTTYRYLQTSGFVGVDRPDAKLADILKHEPRSFEDFVAEIVS